MKEKPSQFLIALAVYCKLLLWKYSHVFACATVHVIAFWQKCKNTSALKMKSKGCFLQMMTFSAWLLEIDWNFIKVYSFSKLCLFILFFCHIPGHCIFSHCSFGLEFSSYTNSEFNIQRHVWERSNLENLKENTSVGHLSIWRDLWPDLTSCLGHRFVPYSCNLLYPEL